jgi:hypothetical protein
MKDKSDQKSLIVNIPIQIHAKIKSIAAIRNITLRKLILRLIINEINKHENYN